MEPEHVPPVETKEQRGGARIREQRRKSDWISPRAYT
jgi:hypothetical protein